MPLAAFTMVYNEADFLPLWVSHYGREVGFENLYCIDHGSDDGSTERSGIKVTKFPRGEFDAGIRSFLVNNVHASLLRNYDVVIFTDVDEFLVADPATFPGLRAAITAAGGPVLRAMGLDVIQDLDREPGIDVALTVFAQRRRVRLAKHHCKTLVAAVPVRWGPGFHSCSIHAQPSTDSFLLHLKYADRAIFLRTIDARHKVKRSEADIGKGFGHHWRMPKEQYLKLVYNNRHLASLEGGTALEPFDAYVARWRREIIGNAPLPDEWITPPTILPERFRDCIPASAPRHDASKPSVQTA